MAKRTLWTILVILFVLVVIGVVGGYFYLTNTKTTIEEVRLENGTSGNVAPFSDLPPMQETSSTSTINSNPLVGDVPKLRKISATPVAGADIFNRKVGTTTQIFIRFVDRGTGNIYETSTSSLITNRITNTTIPKINEAFFAAGGDQVLLRYADPNDVVQTFIGKVTATSSELVGTFGPNNANPLILSSLKNRFFYILGGNQGAVAFISDFANKATGIYNNPLLEWQASWPNEASIVLTTKPAAISNGVAYQLSVKGGSLLKLMGPKSGLVVLPSPKLDTLLYSETIQNTFTSGFHDIKTGQERNFTPSTIPDKCLWAPTNLIVYCGLPKFIPQADYPDSWYQGIVSFDDTIASIDPLSLQRTTLIDPRSVTGEAIDATDLHLSPDGKYLIFTNKKDLSLWGLRLD